MNVKTLYIKIIGDAIIPALGFFLWNWSLYFIVLFYMLDVLVREILIHFKTKKLQHYSQKVVKSEWLLNGAKSGVLFIALLFLIHIAIAFIHPGILFKQEIHDFLTYEELGIQQGFVLIPLVVFMGYASYMNEFIRTKLFAIIDFKSLWNEHLLGLVILLGFVIICIVLASIVQLPEWIYLGLIILATSAYQYYKFKKARY